MNIIENETIPRKNGFTLKELIEGNTIYKNCTFLMDKDAEYCLRYELENDPKSIVKFLDTCNFICEDGNQTIGHSIAIIKTPKNWIEDYFTLEREPIYLKKFPLVNK